MSNNIDYIIVQNVTKSYNASVLILKDVTFSVRKGEIVCLFGPNGCGKTTMLSLLAGLDLDFEGEIIINGRAPQQANVGIIPQHCVDTLLPWRTVLENIALPLEIDGMKLAVREQHVINILQQAKLVLPLYLYPHQISGGYQQLTAILQALQLQPEFLILDEPFSSLDMGHVNDVQDSLLRLWELTNTTIIFTTHDLLTAIKFADRILIFNSLPARIISEFDITLKRPRLDRDPKLIELYDRIHHHYINVGLEN
jgi:ABC-type nitrate/sulfonate/bicarbonate transport system ATPase subunit